ncbi:MAG: hypothetical protein HYW47_05770 [Deltaproteobacteria bacterium]|nr:hypothetical protein [Deltaproteobacteria bacterium]
MCARKNSDDYTAEELKATITAQWLEDKKRIDADPAYEYHHDRDREYKRHLHNKDLQKLFGHAAYLFRGLQEGDMFIYPNEKGVISKVYQEIVKNGYFTASKRYEKKISNWLAKAVSRQTYRRFEK